MFTERAWRRRGLARRLMELAIEWARVKGVAKLVLHASPQGRPLYERLGFEPTNEMSYMGDLPGSGQPNSTVGRAIPE